MKFFGIINVWKNGEQIRRTTDYMDFDSICEWFPDSKHHVKYAVECGDGDRADITIFIQTGSGNRILTFSNFRRSIPLSAA